MGNHRRVGLEFGKQRRERGKWRNASSRLVGRPLVIREWAKAQSKNWPSNPGWPYWKGRFTGGGKSEIRLNQKSGAVEGGAVEGGAVVGQEFRYPCASLPRAITGF